MGTDLDQMTPDEKEDYFKGLMKETRSFPPDPLVPHDLVQASDGEPNNDRKWWGYALCFAFVCLIIALKLTPAFFMH